MIQLMWWYHTKWIIFLGDQNFHITIRYGENREEALYLKITHNRIYCVCGVYTYYIWIRIRMKMLTGVYSIIYIRFLFSNKNVFNVHKHEFCRWDFHKIFLYLWHLNYIYNWLLCNASQDIFIKNRVCNETGYEMMIHLYLQGYLTRHA